MRRVPGSPLGPRAVLGLEGAAWSFCREAWQPLSALQGGLLGRLTKHFGICTSFVQSSRGVSF